MGVRGVSLARRHKHDAERETTRRDDIRIAMLARAARADEAMLRAAIAFRLGILERGPVGVLLAEAPDMGLHDVFERSALQLGRSWVARSRHGMSPVRPLFCANLEDA